MAKVMLILPANRQHPLLICLLKHCWWKMQLYFYDILMQILTWSTEWQFKKRHFASTQGIHNLISLHFLQLRYQSTKSPPKFCIASSLSLPTRASKTVKKSFSIIWVFSFTIFGAKIQIFAYQNKFNFRRENSNICKSEKIKIFGAKIQII